MSYKAIFYPVTKVVSKIKKGHYGKAVFELDWCVKQLDSIDESNTGCFGESQSIREEIKQLKLREWK